MSASEWRSVLLLVAAAAGRSDTVTMTDHLSVNGSLKQASSDMITLEAGFGSGSKTLSIAMKVVESIEFNGITFNPGAPPKALGIGPPLDSAKAAKAKRETESDVLVLRGGQRKECKLVSIDQQSVQCAGKDPPYSRKITLRILVGAR